MVRILGIDIPDNKRGEIGLTYIFGIGRSSANQILADAGIDKNKRVGDWTEAELQTIRNFISQKYKIEGELRSETRLNIKRLVDIDCYIGRRHVLGLPVRGQKTKTNAKTNRGGSSKRPMNTKNTLKKKKGVKK